jgi:hypothetical protein
MSRMRAIASSSVLGLLLFAGSALAPAPVEARVARPTGWAAREPVTVAIVGEHGDSLPTAAHHGTTFVAGELGHRYEIVLTNQTGDRLEVVVSVDGRDVLTGRKADFRKHRGYVLEPFGTVRVDGFRRSLDHVAAFRFAGLEDSFAARSGAPQNVGAIGIAVFRERAHAQIARRPRASTSKDKARDPETRPAADPEATARDRSASQKPAAKSASRAHGAPREDKLGTEFGETRESRVRVVAFTRRDSSRPDARVALQYDSADRLAARGVPIGHVAIVPTAADPDPWPGARDDGFTQPPPPRRR